MTAFIKTSAAVAVAVFSFMLGTRVARFSGSGEDWLIIIMGSLAVAATFSLLMIIFWKPNA